MDRLIPIARSIFSALALCVLLGSPQERSDRILLPLLSEIDQVVGASVQFPGQSVDIVVRSTYQTVCTSYGLAYCWVSNSDVRSNVLVIALDR